VLQRFDKVISTKIQESQYVLNRNEIKRKGVKCDVFSFGSKMSSVQITPPRPIKSRS
jgi:hypothetical protein